MLIILIRHVYGYGWMLAVEFHFLIWIPLSPKLNFICSNDWPYKSFSFVPLDVFVLYFFPFACFLLIPKTNCIVLKYEHVIQYQQSSYNMKKENEKKFEEKNLKETKMKESNCYIIIKYIHWRWHGWIT